MKKLLLITVTALLLFGASNVASAYSRAAIETSRMRRSENARSNSTLPQHKEVTPIDWDTSAAGFQGEKGRTYAFRCPGAGSAKTIYGNDIYTDDSSICTAAVHVGLISLEHGGVVTIEIRPGRSTYGSTTRHGIKSINFGEYGRSFIVLSSDAVRDNSKEGRISNRAESDDIGGNEVTPINWDTGAAGFQGQTGKTYAFRCPGEGSANTIYGNDIYTDDSSICTAAVHVGLITLERGGLVTIEIRPGRSTYGSTTRHGIKSTSWGEYARSFVIR